MLAHEATRFLHANMSSFCSQNVRDHKLKGWLTYSLSPLQLLSPALLLLLLPLPFPELSVLFALSATSSGASLLNISVIVKSCDSIASLFAHFLVGSFYTTIWQWVVFTNCMQKSAVFIWVKTWVSMWGGELHVYQNWIFLIISHHRTIVTLLH